MQRQSQSDDVHIHKRRDGLIKSIYVCPLGRNLIENCVQHCLANASHLHFIFVYHFNLCNAFVILPARLHDLVSKIGQERITNLASRIKYTFHCVSIVFMCNASVAMPGMRALPVRNVYIQREIYYTTATTLVM